MKKIEFAIKHLQTCYLDHRVSFAHNTDISEDESELKLEGYRQAIIDLKRLLNDPE